MCDALIRINMIINSTLDIETIMQRIAIEAADTIGCDSTFIALSEGNRWRMRYLHKLPRELTEKTYSDNDLPHVAIAVNTKEPILISAVARDSRVNPEVMESMGVKSVLTVPLMVKDRAIGAACFNYQEKEVDFGDREINFARQVASSISLALSNSSLYGEVKEARDLDDALNRINTLVHSTLNIDEIMNRVITEGTDALGAESAMVFFQSDDQWEVRYVYKLPGELIGRKYDSETVKHTVIAAQTKEPVSISDMHHDDRIDPHFAESLHIKSLLDFPLLAKEKALGDVVFHYHSKPVAFSDTHIEFARKLTASLASALENSQLFEQLRKAEAELRTSEARFYSLASTALDAIILIDNDGNVSFWNDAATRIFGYTNQEVSGKYLHSFIMPERHIDTFRKGYETFQKTGQGPFIGKVYETEGKRKDGTEFPVELSLAALKLKDTWNAVGIVRDITTRKQEEKTRAYLSAIVESTSAAVISLTKDLNGIIQTWNKGAERVYGYSAEEAVGRHISFLVPPGHKDDIPDILERVKRGESVERYETVRTRKDGTHIHVSLDVSPILDPQGTIMGAATIAHNITDRKYAEEKVRESREQLQVIIDTVPSLISYVDRNFHYRWNNRTYREWFHRTAEEITGRHMRDILGEEVFQRILPRLQKALSGEVVYYDDYLAYPSGGRWVHGVYMPNRTARGEVDGIVVFVNDITERKKMEEEIRHMAHHDALTGLPNRRLFRDVVNMEMAQARRTRKKLAILFLDLDRFKEVNDTLGHEAGDALLKEVARRLRANIRESDTVARIGGDEFNILLADIPRPEDVTAVARKIMGSFERPFLIAGHELHVTASIGISVYPDDSEETDTLFRYADIAMYHAKERGKNNFQFYNPDINVRSVERMLLESSLRQAIERGELSVHYQPQIDIRTGRIVCAEALVRWRHPERGMLSSNRFIPAAEEIGFVTAIDEWVLRTACEQFKAWQEAGYPPVCVTVNLSAREFQNPGLVATIGRILDETGLSPDCLDIEITESMAMRDIDHTVKLLNELTARGVRISIDDFGTGYSSLSDLKRLPIQRLKIDRSFVQDITTDPDNRAIIQAVTVMAHTMKMTVVAEGVETEEQLSFLRETRCDEAQGYFYSKPLPDEEFRRLIAGGK